MTTVVPFPFQVRKGRPLHKQPQPLPGRALVPPLLAAVGVAVFVARRGAQEHPLPHHHPGRDLRQQVRRESGRPRGTLLPAGRRRPILVGPRLRALDSEVRILQSPPYALAN